VIIAGIWIQGIFRFLLDIVFICVDRRIHDVSDFFHKIINNTFKNFTVSDTAEDLVDGFVDITEQDKQQIFIMLIISLGLLLVWGVLSAILSRYRLQAGVIQLSLWVAATVLLTLFDVAAVTYFTLQVESLFKKNEPTSSWYQLTASFVPMYFSRGLWPIFNVAAIFVLGFRIGTLKKTNGRVNSRGEVDTADVTGHIGNDALNTYHPEPDTSALYAYVSKPPQHSVAQYPPPQQSALLQTSSQRSSALQPLQQNGGINFDPYDPSAPSSATYSYAKQEPYAPIYPRIDHAMFPGNTMQDNVNYSQHNSVANLPSPKSYFVPVLPKFDYAGFPKTHVDTQEGHAQYNDIPNADYTPPSNRREVVAPNVPNADYTPPTHRKQDPFSLPDADYSPNPNRR